MNHYYNTATVIPLAQRLGKKKNIFSQLIERWIFKCNLWKNIAIFAGNNVRSFCTALQKLLTFFQ